MEGRLSGRGSVRPKLGGSDGMVAGWEQGGHGHPKDCPPKLRARAAIGEETVACLVGEKSSLPIV